jgi:hypothetical protein
VQDAEHPIDQQRAFGLAEHAIALAERATRKTTSPASVRDRRVALGERNLHAWRELWRALCPLTEEIAAGARLA